MAKQTAPISEEIIDSVLPGLKQIKLYAGDGLIMLVNPIGSKLWRFRYRFQGKEKMISLGSYPETSLERARLLLSDAKYLLKNGLDPSAERKMEKATGESEAYHVVNTSVRISNDGMLEIWKGRIALRLTLDEACFINDQLCRLIA